MAQPGIDRDDGPGAGQNLRHLLKAHARQHFNILPAFRQPLRPRLFVRGPHGSLMWTPLSASRSRSSCQRVSGQCLSSRVVAMQKHQIGRGSASLVLQEMARNGVIPWAWGFA